MAETVIKNQIRTTQAGPLDVKATPVDTMTDLYNIPRSQRYESMTVFVKDVKKEYWLVDGTLNLNWVVKNTNTIEGDDI